VINGTPLGTSYFRLKEQKQAGTGSHMIFFACINGKRPLFKITTELAPLASGAFY
jgi:hypothetical protein